MKAVVQRVKHASVTIEGEVYGKIDQGLMILFGACDDDTLEIVPKLAQKVAGLRIFSDENDKMNLSALELGYSALVVPNFTLFANTKKGFRPSFMAAARPMFANIAFNLFVDELKKYAFKQVKTGKFGADMQVNLLIDGPITIIVDTKEW